jgi:sugar/nucleoside kinase (ribokinase family)
MVESRLARSPSRTSPGVPKVVVVGSVGLDDIATPSARTTGQLGGSASYACIAASFFTSAGMVGIVGSDFPRRFIRRFLDAGVDLCGLQRVEGRTFRWSGVYEGNLDHRRTLKTELNVFAHFRPDLPPGYRRARHVLLANIAPALQLHVLDQVRNPRFVAADTMNLWIQTARPDLLRVIKRIDLLTLNESEAREWTGRSGLGAAANRLLALGPRWVLIKRGGTGSRLFSREGSRLLPAYPVDSVRDPTGAGDLFAGGLMGHLAREPRIDEAAIHRAMLAGSVVASLGVERFGLEAFWKTSRRDLEDRIRSFRQMCGWKGHP